MGRIYVHCCNVFSKILYMHSQCGSVFINAFLQYSHVATRRCEGCVRTHWCNAACLFCGDVCLMWSEEEDRVKAGFCEVFWWEKKSFWKYCWFLWCDWGNFLKGFCWHSCDWAASCPHKAWCPSDWWLLLRLLTGSSDCWGKTEQSDWSFCSVRGSPLLKNVFVSTGCSLRQ